jgi:ABC-type sugar transport system ATPase subunit
LSGGNQQKVMLAKFLALQPRIVLLDDPTHGVDVGTKVEIYRSITDLAAGGAAVLIVSSELLELIGLCHRIIVLHEGRKVAEFVHDDFDEGRILSACFGEVVTRGGD